MNKYIKILFLSLFLIFNYDVSIAQTNNRTNKNNNIENNIINKNNTRSNRSSTNNNNTNENNTTNNNSNNNNLNYKCYNQYPYQTIKWQDQQLWPFIQSGYSIAIEHDLKKYPLASRKTFNWQIVETSSSFGSNIEISASPCPGDFNYNILKCNKKFNSLGGVLELSVGKINLPRLNNICEIPTNIDKYYLNVRHVNCNQFSCQNSIMLSR